MGLSPFGSHVRKPLLDSFGSHVRKPLLDSFCHVCLCVFLCVFVCAGLNTCSLSFSHVWLFSMLLFHDFQKSHQGFSLLFEASILFAVPSISLAAHYYTTFPKQSINCGNRFRSEIQRCEKCTWYIRYASSFIP